MKHLKKYISQHTSILTVDFCCGTNPRMTQFILEYLMTRWKEQKAMAGLYFPIMIPLRLIYESQMSLMQCKQLSIFFPIKNWGLQIREENEQHVKHHLQQSLTHNENGLFSLLKMLRINIGFIPCLPSLLNCTKNLKHLHIIHDSVHLDTSHIAAYFKAVSALKNLKDLVMEVYSKTGIDVTDLLEMKTKNNLKLNALILGGCIFRPNSMANYLKMNISISWLSLFLQDDKALEVDNILRVLPDLRSLSKFGLSNCRFSSGRIGNLHPIATQLTSLSLVSCGLTEDHLLNLFSFLSKAKELLIVDLSRNQFSRRSVHRLAQCLGNIPCLLDLRLENVGLGDLSATWLAQSLQHNTTLKKLILDRNWIGQVGKQALFWIYVQIFFRNQPEYPHKITDSR